MAIVLEKPQEVSRDHFLISIRSTGEIPQPGQFVNIKISGNSDPLLRRPFSIFNHYDNIIELIIKIAGKGTKYLCENLKPGEIDMIAPLGKGFSICENKNVLLIGGGVGNAPLYYLARALRSKNNTIDYIYASRSKEYIYKKNEFKSVPDNFYLSTDDGTDGIKGLAADLAEEITDRKKFDNIYICGPTPMMKSIVNKIIDSKAYIEASLENYFGCGIGLCSGCSVETKTGNKRACIDGPAFDARIINWESL